VANDEQELNEPIASAVIPTTKQRLFVRYFTAILIDLTVINIFAEHWEYVIVDSFSMTLLAAILLQALLRATLALEHSCAAYFNSKSGGFAKFMRYFSAWSILFISKFVMLGLVDWAFGEHLSFVGPLHGVVAFFTVIFAMLGAEELVIRFVRRLN
jgi:hypothetical protein